MKIETMIVRPEEFRKYFQADRNQLSDFLTNGFRTKTERGLWKKVRQRITKHKNKHDTPYQCPPGHCHLLIRKQDDTVLMICESIGNN